MSWIREHVRTRTPDPIPHVQFGKYVRFEWGSQELEDWLSHHRHSATRNKKKPSRVS